MKKRTALISVYYKEGLAEFASELVKRNFEILSTGGTYRFLKEKSIPVTSVESVTSFPEVLDGRVKTLHPAVFSGILAQKDNPEHMKQISEHGLKLIDLVVVTLYPFAETISKPDVKHEDAVEQIDIGGVSLIRAAAKNYSSVCVLVKQKQYSGYLKEFDRNEGEFGDEYKIKLARDAFELIEEYDRDIKNYFFKVSGNESGLRYGENPHQKAHFEKTNFDELFEILHGKELSYNNLLDVDAAHSLINEFENENPTAAIIKHGNPSGVATRENLLEAYRKAFETDTVSPYGGIVIFNRVLDMKTALEADKIFTEILLAPGFEEGVLELLMKKKNRRLIRFNFGRSESETRTVTGGFLHQERDCLVLKREELNYVTEKKPTEEQLKDIEFAYKIVKYTKSNAVVFIKNLQTLGIGGGQPSRVDSTKLAVWKAKQFNLDLKDSVAASDAYFPFADGLIETANAGATCVVQPGGSVRDDEVIKAAEERHMCMVFTGYRHFRH
ncbi:MAG: bifunctional phosphoribosylaminoimidazolecarboxamide formyltransferase/IMP cyclohydrolase [Ignavibacteria bacterium]|nr:bifunctional phosphoribosylaminoimidazolecarboxamide formyltransferase/IMP cyclohydrolase [Ignavibacteria bacterium]